MTRRQACPTCNLDAIDAFTGAAGLGIVVINSKALCANLREARGKTSARHEVNNSTSNLPHNPRCPKLQRRQLRSVPQPHLETNQGARVLPENEDVER